MLYNLLIINKLSIKIKGCGIRKNLIGTTGTGTDVNLSFI
jgi:hypothetical protein